MSRNLSIFLKLPVLLVFLALVSCKVGMPTLGGVRGVNFVSGKNGQIGIEAEIQVNNPNSFGIRIKKLKAEVFIDNSPMGNITGGKKIKIKPLSNDYHKVSLNTDIGQLLTSTPTLINMFTGGKSNFRIKGGGVAGVFIFRKKFSFDHQDRIDLKGFPPQGR